MGIQHSPGQRKRLALKAAKQGIEAVAAQAGVKPGTVRAWCAEFDVGAGAGSPAAATPLHVAGSPRAASDGPASLPTPEPVQGVGDLIDKAGDALACELSSWLADAESRELASEQLAEVISDWEAEHGALTVQELEAARAQLFE